MTREEKIQAILTAIQDPVKLQKFMILMITQNIGNVADDRLDMALMIINGQI